jgi:hypothetical protein
MANNHPTVSNQLPQSLTSTPTMQYRPLRYIQDPSVYVGMDQFDYFLGMLQSYLDEKRAAWFWQCIREDCPELMRIIEAKQTASLTAFKAITLTWELSSQAFDSKELERN